MVPRVAAQSGGPGRTHHEREETNLQLLLGSPMRCMCVCGCMGNAADIIIIIIKRRSGINPIPPTVIDRD